MHLGSCGHAVRVAVIAYNEIEVRWHEYDKEYLIRDVMMVKD